MEIIHLTHREMPENLDSHVMAIGFFDGVHFGHQELLSRAKGIAGRKGCKFSAMTFSPHPDEVIRKDKPRKYLMTLPQKIRKMEEMGVDTLFVVKFDMDFASLPPLEFIRRYIENLNACHVVVGFDFTFGFKAQGNTELLEQESEQSNYGLSVISKKTFSNEKISSTLIRHLVRKGEVERLPAYLGTYYEIDVKVASSMKKGINIVVPSPKTLLPPEGCYEVAVQKDGRSHYGKLHKYWSLGEKMELETYVELEGEMETCTIAFLENAEEVESESLKLMEEIVYG